MGKQLEKLLITLPSAGWGIFSPLGELAAGVLLMGAGTWGRDQLFVVVCIGWWQAGIVRDAWVLELSLLLTQVYLASFYCPEDPPEQTLPALALPPV